MVTLEQARELGKKYDKLLEELTEGYCGIWIGAGDESIWEGEPPLNYPDTVAFTAEGTDACQGTHMILAVSKTDPETFDILDADWGKAGFTGRDGPPERVTLEELEEILKYFYEGWKEEVEADKMDHPGPRQTRYGVKLF